MHAVDIGIEISRRDTREEDEKRSVHEQTADGAVHHAFCSDEFVQDRFAQEFVGSSRNCFAKKA